MKRALAIGVLLGFALSFAPQALARPPGEFPLSLSLNGELTKLGVLTSTGTSVNNTTTAVPFTVTTASCPSRVTLWDCDGAAFIRNGTTCSHDITNANYGVYAAAHDLKQMLLKDATTTICLDTAGSTVNCAVFCQD